MSGTSIYVSVVTNGPTATVAATTVAHAATWGAFQSMFQLSVAINVAVAVLHDIIGDMPEKRAAEAHELGTRANDAKAFPLAKEIFELETAFTDGAAAVKNRFFRFLGPICIGIAVISLILLCWSAFVYEAPIHWAFQVVGPIEFLPLLAGIVVISRSFYAMTTELIPKLHGYESQVQSAERSRDAT